MRRIAISVVAAAVLTLGVGGLGWWSTAMIRPPAEVTAIVDTIQQGGLAPRIQQRLGVTDPGPAQQLSQFIIDRRTATRQRVLLSVGVTFFATIGTIWLALAAAERWKPRDSPAFNGVEVIPHTHRLMRSSTPQ